MKLTLAIAAAGLLLRFQTPGAGRYLVFADHQTYLRIVLASNHETNAVHVAVPIKAKGSNELFWVWFKADSFPTGRVP